MTELISKYLKEAGYDSFSVSQNGDSFESSLGIDLTTYIEKALVDELRKMRNIRLSETDWWASSDLTMTAEQSAYRKAEYPDWGTQLDKIYDDGLTKWKSEMVDPVKAKWPKDNSGPK